MRAGTLRTPAIIVSATESSDWQLASDDRKPLWRGFVGIAPLRGELRVQYQAEFVGVTHTVTMRYSKFVPVAGQTVITDDDRKRSLAIKHVINVSDRDHELQLVCVENLNDAA